MCCSVVLPSSQTQNRSSTLTQGTPKLAGGSGNYSEFLIGGVMRAPFRPKKHDIAFVQLTTGVAWKRVTVAYAPSFHLAVGLKGSHCKLSAPGDKAGQSMFEQPN